MPDLEQPRYTCAPVVSDTFAAVDAVVTAGVAAGFSTKFSFNFAMILLASGGTAEQGVRAFQQLQKGRWVQ